MTGRAVVIAVAAFCATALPAFGQTTFAADLQPLVETFQSGNATQATVEAVDAYVAAHPADGNGYALKCAMITANTQAKGVDPDQAVPLCRKGLELAPDSAFANSAMADVTYNMGKPAASIPFYSKAIALGMTGDGVFWKRCDAYRLSGNLDAALLDCKKQIELTPDAFPARYAYGHLQYVRKNYEDAIAYLTSALALKPSDINALYWRALAYASAGKYQEATADLTACILNGDKSPDTYFARGMILREYAKPGAGDSDLQKAMEGYRANGQTDRADRVQMLLAQVPRPEPSAPANATFEYDGMSFDGPEVATLFNGVRAAFDPKNFSVHIDIVLTPAAKMPPYDRNVHYAGPRKSDDGKPAFTILILDSLKQEQMAVPLTEGAFFGLTDTGYAGPRWKALYDQEAAKDAALGANASDPFLNRRQFVAALEKLFTSVAKTVVTVH
jgi:tetratricopeptide (TPR) repeat protein